MAINPLDAHKPREPKKPNSMKNYPSTRLNYLIRRGDYDEWVLLGLARYQSERLTTFAANNAIENKDRHPVYISFDYVPDLPNL
jgi:hypothetical protein